MVTPDFFSSPFPRRNRCTNLIGQAEKRSRVGEDTGTLPPKHGPSSGTAARGLPVLFYFPLLMMALWGFSTHAAAAESGFYLSGELGANFASGLDMTGTSNDRASVCDEFINPMFATVTQTEGYENYNCTGPNRGIGNFWKNGFDSAEGILAGAALGYDIRGKYPGRGWGRFRFELEYFFRDTGYDQTSPIPGATGVQDDKLAQEIRTAIDRIGNVTAHNLFANLYFDYPNSSRYTPYVGIGAGVGYTDMDYASVWARNPDVNAISTGAGLPNVDEIRRNLAGSTSSAQTELSDTLFGYQALFGLDYAVTESITFGVKGRWVNFDSFSGDNFVWDPLRSHAPNLRKDLSEPVWGWLTTGDLKMFGVSLTMKYHF